MSSSRSTLFDFDSSSSSDDSDIDNPLDDDMEQFVLAAKELQELLRKKRQGSKVGRLCILRNRVLGNEFLMQDYFVQVPTYPAHLFHRRYQMHRSLFVKIVEACEANYRYFTTRRNAAGLLGFSPY
jgi:hypothetical protein